ncbi:MAG: rhomboid family intramembrane serine protease [Planctomycetes bacterium]|nr:rhomboid family intramembrane serine protease [Planctomycetota bacterium]
MADKGKPSGLRIIIAWIALLWLIELCDIALTWKFGPHQGGGVWEGGFLDVRFGLQPRMWWGLIGIPCAPFLHGGFAHLAVNSLGLLLLGWASLAYSSRLTSFAVGYAVLYSGVLTWLIGESGSCHIGASGVIFGLIGFLFGNGLFRRGFLPLILAVVTMVLFGGALPQALPVPQTGPVHYSWEMHLGGLLGGLSASWHLRKEKA